MVYMRNRSSCITNMLFAPTLSIILHIWNILRHRIMKEGVDHRVSYDQHGIYHKQNQLPKWSSSLACSAIYSWSLVRYGPFYQALCRKFYILEGPVMGERERRNVTHISQSVCLSLFLYLYPTIALPHSGH